MPLPSLYRSGEPERAWKVSRAALYGAIIGAFAALFRTFGPLRASAAGVLTHRLAEIAIAALAFALLCVVAAMLRNFLARHLIWHEDR
jgi:hypothetical protein